MQRKLGGSSGVAHCPCNRRATPFVLKPQLEGGGNLLASCLADALRLSPTDPFGKRVRSEFILMERIAYPRTTGSILRFGE